LKVKAKNSAAKWKIIVAVFTGHGHINYPAKESCVLITYPKVGNENIIE
jgi:hypothetical protein